MIAFFLGLPPCGYSTRFVTCDSDNLAVYRGAAFGGPTRPAESKGHQNNYFRPKGGGGELDILRSKSFKSVRQTKWNSVNICDYFRVRNACEGRLDVKKCSYLTAASNISNKKKVSFSGQ